MVFFYNRKGFRPPRFFLLADGFFFLGFAFLMLRNLVLLLNTFVINYAMRFESVPELTLVSLVLEDRINRFKIEKERERTNTRNKIAQNLHDDVSVILGSIVVIPG